MIVIIGNSGQSFSGLGKYLTHDPSAESSERVAWTHTENLANDYVPAAINEMVWTARDAEILKQEAGVRGGGRATEKPVKHVSLNWAHEDNPSEKHMLASARHFVESMKWHEHQAIYVAHNDKEHRHVHIMLNAVHPETGLKLNEDFEQRRAQKWAAAYELEQGIIRCEQRTVDVTQREKAMPRNIWLEFQKNEMEFKKAEEKLQVNSEKPEIRPQSRVNFEWDTLDEIQRNQRLAFFEDGKQKFKKLRNGIYREVREEFRERWADFYAADKKTVGDDRDFLKAVKEQIIADQKAALEPRRDAACAELMAQRQQDYDALKLSQKADRRELRERLSTGIDNSDFFDRLSRGNERELSVKAEFRAGKREVTARDPESRQTSQADYENKTDRQETVSRRQVNDFAEAAPRRAIASIGSFLDALFFDITTLGSAPPQEPDFDWRETLRVSAEETTKHRLHQEQEKHDIEWRERSKQSYGE